MFETQEKVLRKVYQDREKGDLARARQRAVEGLRKWPDDYDLAVEAVQLCFETEDFNEATRLLKSVMRHHPREKGNLLDLTRETCLHTWNPALAWFLLEVLVRGREIDAVRDLLRRAPAPLPDDLAKRARTRKRSLEENGQGRSPGSTDAALLLGLCLLETGRHAEAAAALGSVLPKAPEIAHAVGEILVDLEREIPDDAETKFHIGLASIILEHPEKAETRFFQCLELDDPPLDRLRKVLEGHPSPSPAHDLLLGETLVRLGETAAGVETIRRFVEAADDAPPDGEIHRLLTGRVGRAETAARRLELLAARFDATIAVVMLFAETAARIGLVAGIVDAFERCYLRDRSCGEAILRWIGEREEILLTGPAQRLIARIHLHDGAWEAATAAVRRSFELDRSQLDALGGMVDEATASSDDPALRLLEAELCAMRGDAAEAERIAREMEERGSADNDDLMKITGAILTHCGVNIDTVSAAVQAAIRGGTPDEALPWVREYIRAGGDQEALAEAIAAAADGPGRWPGAVSLVDGLGDLDLALPLRILQARAHLESGAVERAVLEFDGIMLRSAAFRFDLLAIYEEALARFDGNPTLHLALYHLHLDDDRPVQAARHLCRTLELDPGQIRDVLDRFNALVEANPTERGLWEEMLAAAVRMGHDDLARETLRRAVASLPEPDAAALHIYGARLSSGDGDSRDGLRCIALALTAPDADLRAVETELGRVIEREPENAEASFLLGDCLLRMGDEKQAVGSFERCLAVSGAFRTTIRERLEAALPRSVEPWTLSRLLGTIALNDGRSDDARRLFAAAQNGPAGEMAALGADLAAATGRAPDDTRLALLFARNRVIEKRPDEAVAILERLAGDGGDLDRPAAGILDELLGVMPDHIAANRLLATIRLRGGDVEGSLAPALRLLELENEPPEAIGEAVAPFLDALGGDPRFIVPWGRLLARRGDHGGAIKAFRRALDIDTGCWERVLAGLDAASWPETIDGERRLLRADALIAGGRHEPAFALLSAPGAARGCEAKEIFRRLEALVDAAPEPAHFPFGGQLLARAGKIDEAEAFMRRGIDILGKENALEIEIELAEMLEAAGRGERAADIFRAVLGNAPDRAGVLKRIERSSTARRRREIDGCVGRLAELSADESARLARLAVDCGEAEAAMEIAAAASLEGGVRAAILARAYLSLDRPLLALAAVGAADRRERRGDDIDAELLYIEGAASERIGDWLRAASAFGRIAALRGDWLDAVERAGRNYAKTIEMTDDAAVLEKTGALEPVAAESEDRS
ncbi:MAG: tetratricopeptide repeat protein [Candidatus Krumholzibacteriota bacterium]|nr:tetratricopeptide repeat protein [Candidatus Krumholzibacteriota bacterium]